MSGPEQTHFFENGLSRAGCHGTLFRLLHAVHVESMSQDRSFVQALGFLLERERSTGEWLLVSADADPALDLSWIPDGWWKLVTGERTRDQRPARLHRRHFEVCAFSQLMLELKSGDATIVGSDRFADYRDQLISWENHHRDIAAYGEMVGIAIEGDAFVDQMRRKPLATAQATDHSFPDNQSVRIERGEAILLLGGASPYPPPVTDGKPSFVAVPLDPISSSSPFKVRLNGISSSDASSVQIVSGAGDSLTDALVPTDTLDSAHFTVLYRPDIHGLIGRGGNSAAESIQNTLSLNVIPYLGARVVCSTLADIFSRPIPSVLMQLEFGAAEVGGRSVDPFNVNSAVYLVAFGPASGVFSWTVTPPAGANVIPSDPSSSLFNFMSDVEGRYDVTVTHTYAGTSVSSNLHVYRSYDAGDPANAPFPSDEGAQQITGGVP